MLKLIKSNKLLFKFRKSFYTKIYRSMSEMQKATVRCRDEESVMQVSFIYTDESLPLYRRFNLNRKKDEQISQAFDRIRASILNCYEKKLNRKKRKVKANAPSEATTEFELPEIHIQIQHGDKVIPVDTINSEAWTDGAILTVGNVSYNVLYNAPIVKSISLPKSIMAGYPVYPKLEMEFTTETDMKYQWLKTITKKEIGSEKDTLTMINNQYWKPVGSSFYYLPSNYDIGKILKINVTPGRDGISGLSLETTAIIAVQAGPGECPFEIRHLYTKNLTEKGFFRCLSYNILADLYADSDFTRNNLFPYCPPYALAIDYRKQLFLKEIIGYNADLICLQEVDKKIFLSDLYPVLKNTNFEGVFHLKGGQVSEGLATFYRKSKFRLINNEVIILSEYLPKGPEMSDILDAICANDKLKERFLARTTALQITLLQSIEDASNFFLVGNTHLYFHPDADHIRLLQASACIRYLEEKLKKFQSEKPEHKYAVILSGDFNSTPEWGVYQLMTTGQVHADIRDWKSNLEQQVKDFEMSHNLSLGSACGTPTYTNYTAGFNGCLDYIYYDKSKFEVTEVIPMPSHEEVTQNIAIPNINFPSDHIAIGCTLKWSA